MRYRVTPRCRVLGFLGTDIISRDKDMLSQLHQGVRVTASIARCRAPIHVCLLLLLARNPLDPDAQVRRDVQGVGQRRLPRRAWAEGAADASANGLVARPNATDGIKEVGAAPGRGWPVSASSYRMDRFSMSKKKRESGASLPPCGTISSTRAISALGITSMVKPSALAEQDADGGGVKSNCAIAGSAFPPPRKWDVRLALGVLPSAEGTAEGREDVASIGVLL